MKVKHLKRLLEKLPEDSNIYVDIGDNMVPGNEWGFEVSHVKTCAIKHVLNGKVAQRPCKETKAAKKSLVIAFRKDS